LNSAITEFHPEPEDILDKLNPGQLAVATIKQGVHVGVAGPGTGKTTAQNACASIKIINGMDPSSIASITFTNKAAEEMRTRLVETIGKDGYRAFVGTFHQLALKKILRVNARNDYFIKGKYPNGFSIIDAADSSVLLDNAYKACSEKVKSLMENAKVDKDTVKTLMSLQKGKGNNSDHFLSHIPGNKYLVSQIVNNEIGDSDGEINTFILNNPESKNVLIYLWWSKYEVLCSGDDVMDFDDILLHSLKLIDYDQSVSKRLASQFLHVQVDEYQDTNEIQFQILRKIIDQQRVKSLLIVGDMRQAIYGFRGADSESMNKVVKYYNAQIIPMDRNYRTTDKSMEAINQFGETMSNQLTDGKLESMSGRVGTSPQVHAFETDVDEAEYIIKDVRKKLESGVPPNEIAVIYRGKAAVKTLKRTLETERIQFETVGDTDFYSMKEVKVTMALMRILVNEDDRYALYKLMDEIKFGTTKEFIRKEANKASLTPMSYLKSVAKGESAKAAKVRDFLNGIEDINCYLPYITPDVLAISHGISEQEYTDKCLTDSAFKLSHDNQVLRFVTDVAPMFSERILEFFNNSISEGFHKTAKTAFLKKNPNATDDEIHEHAMKIVEKRRERVIKLTDILSKTLLDGATYQEAVDELQLLADNTKNNKVGSIFLMTGHASKGLEFEHTYFLGAEQESFFRSENPDDSTIYEEERLFYVGTTRHKESLQITRCNTRFVNGETKYFEPLEMLLRLKGAVDSFDWTIEGKAETQKLTSTQLNKTSSIYIDKSTSTFNSDQNLLAALKRNNRSVEEKHKYQEANNNGDKQSSSESFKQKLITKKNHPQKGSDVRPLDEQTDPSENENLLFNI
jgi:DNA helicase-2/ATP-dependent DNA helicase PcrA